MAIRLKNKQNTWPEESEYPYGDIKDDDGSGNGTPVNREVYADQHQFFARMMAEAIRLKPPFDYNDVPDNSYDGFQLYEALMLLTRPYKYYIATLSQSGTNAPVAVVHENTIGAIVWSYIGVGTYRATLAGAFPVTNDVWRVISGVGNGGSAKLYSLDQDRMTIITYDNAGAGANDLLDLTSIEIRVYP